MKKIITALLACILLSSCMATHKAMTKGKLDVKTKMSDTIFLDPVSDDKKIVYVKIRNTSGNTGLNIEPYIIGLLASRGYIITQNPENAWFILQANVLQAGKIEDENSLYTSFGDAIIPGVLGGVIGKNAGDDTGAVIGAVAGATVGFVGSTLVQDVTYSIITDIQVSQKIDPSFVDIKNDDDEPYDEENGWKKYLTRVVSYANQVNLDYKEAEPKLISALTNSIAGVL